MLARRAGLRSTCRRTASRPHRGAINPDKPPPSRVGRWAVWTSSSIHVVDGFVGAPARLSLLGGPLTQSVGCARAPSGEWVVGWGSYSFRSTWALLGRREKRVAFGVEGGGCAPSTGTHGDSHGRAETPPKRGHSELTMVAGDQVRACAKRPQRVGTSSAIGPPSLPTDDGYQSSIGGAVVPGANRGAVHPGSAFSTCERVIGQLASKARASSSSPTW